MTPARPTPAVPSGALPPAPFGRLLTAMVTPFVEDGSAVDLPAARRLARHLVEIGCDGLVINGTTGESATLRDEEKTALVRAVVAEVGGEVPVVVGAGNNDTRHSIDLVREAEDAGADALLVVTPYYNKPPQEGLIGHFTAVADAASKPVILYDIPGRTGTAISGDTLIELAHHPRIVAVKDAKGDLAESTRVMEQTDLTFYSGEDALNLPWLAIGAAGVISVVAHVAAPAYRRMIDALDAGDLATARAAHRSVNPAVTAVMTRMQGAIAAKTALHLQGVLDNATVRLPLAPATGEQRARLFAELDPIAEQCGITPWKGPHA